MYKFCRAVILVFVGGEKKIATHELDVSQAGQVSLWSIASVDEKGHS